MRDVFAWLVILLGAVTVAYCLSVADGVVTIRVEEKSER